jgi:hypothetical protein
MQSWTNKIRNPGSATKRVAYVYGLLTCLCLALAITKGATSSELVSGLKIFAIGGVLIGLIAWGVDRSRQDTKEK